MGITIHFTADQLKQGRMITQQMSRLQQALNRLSSGVKVQSAAEGAATLAINERLNSELRGAQMELRNLGDKSSMLQTLDGALSEATGSLQSLRELAVSAASELLSTEDREAMERQFKELVRHLDTISEDTTFNHKRLLNGEIAELSLSLRGDTRNSSSTQGPEERLLLPNLKSSRLGQNVSYGSRARGAFIAPLQTDDLTINGVSIRGTTDYDDQTSYTFRSGSAIAKSKAINSVSALTGVRARVDSNVIRGISALKGFTLGPDRSLKINGYLISGELIEDGDASGALRNAINELSSKSGVTATLDVDRRLVLSAEDGRNITVEYSDFELRKAIGIVDTAGDEVNFSDEVTPPVYLSDGDIVSVDYVTDRSDPLNAPSGSYDGSFEVIENQFFKRADGVDYIFEVVKAGAVGEAQFRVKEEALDEGTSDFDEDEGYDFGAYGGEYSAPSAHKVRVVDSEYLGASRLKITLAVSEDVNDAGSAASPVEDERPTVMVSVSSLDDPSLAPVELGEVVISNDQTLDLSSLSHPLAKALPATLRFPVDKTSYLLDAQGDPLNFNRSVPYLDPAEGHDYSFAPFIKGWSGMHTTDFTITVQGSGHALGPYVYSNAAPRATAAVTADLVYQPDKDELTTDPATPFVLNPYDSASHYFEVDTEDHPSNLGGLSFDFTGTLNVAKLDAMWEYQGEHRAGMLLNSSRFSGPEPVRYELEFTSVGVLSRSGSNGPDAIIRAYELNDVGEWVEITEPNDPQVLTNLRSNHPYGFHGEDQYYSVYGYFYDMPKAEIRDDSAIPVGQVSVNPIYYTGDIQERVGVVRATETGMITPSTPISYEYYYEDDPSTIISTGELKSGVTLGEGIILYFAPTAEVTATAGVPTHYYKLHSGGYNDSEAKSFSSELKRVDGVMKLITTWSDGAQFTRDFTFNDVYQHIGKGVRLQVSSSLYSHTNLYKDGTKWEGTIEPTHISEGEMIKFNLDPRPVAVGDKLTVEVEPEDLVSGSSWSFTAVAGDWKPGESHSVELDTGFQPELHTMVDLLSDQAGSAFGAIALTGSGRFEVGDQLRVETRAFVGEVRSSGAYRRSISPTDYVLTVTKAGEVTASGTSAQLAWARDDGLTDTENGGSGEITGFTLDEKVYLEEGVELSFHDLGEGVYLAEGDEIRITVGRNLKYSFGGQVSLHSDERFELEYADSALDRQLGRLMFIGSDEQALSAQFSELSLSTGLLAPTETSSISNAGLMSLSEVRAALDTIDSALQQVSDARGLIGSGLNRLEHQINGLADKAAGLMGVQERLMGADISAELLDVTAEQIKVMTAPMIFDFHLFNPRQALQLVKQTER